MNALQVLVTNTVNVIFVILECIAIAELFLETTKNQKKLILSKIALGGCSVMAILGALELKAIALSAIVVIIIGLIYEGKTARKFSTLIGVLGAYYMSEMPLNYVVRHLLGVDSEGIYTNLFIGRIVICVTIALISIAIKRRGLFSQLHYLKEKQEAQYLAAVRAIGFYERMDQMKHERDEVETYLYEQVEAMKDLITEGKTDEILTILKEMHGKQNEEVEPIETGNQVINMIVNEKYAIACEKNISMKVNVSIPDTLHVDSRDLCSIISNSIDYGIENCEDLEGKEGKKLRVEGIWIKGYLIFKVWSSAKKTSSFEREHCGIESIKSHLQKYDGGFELSKENKWHKLEFNMNDCGILK